VYTPTRNIVYHDPGPNPQGNDPKGWPKQEEIRQMSLKRVQTFLQIDGGDAKRSSQANLGIYGLGKRRTLRQLMDFVGVDLYQRTGNGEVRATMFLHSAMLHVLLGYLVFLITSHHFYPFTTNDLNSFLIEYEMR
jgi:hypothetical protein